MVEKKVNGFKCFKVHFKHNRRKIAQAWSVIQIICIYTGKRNRYSIMSLFEIHTCRLEPQMSDSPNMRPATKDPNPPKISFLPWGNGLILGRFSASFLTGG